MQMRGGGSHCFAAYDVDTRVLLGIVIFALLLLLGRHHHRVQSMHELATQGVGAV